MFNRKLILASASPRRLTILNQIGLNPVVIIPDIIEKVGIDEVPHVFASRLAFEKGDSVAKMVGDEVAVLSADTIVVHENMIIGKPLNQIEAREMLIRLSGKMHQVITAISVIWHNQYATDYEVTNVWFSDLSKDLIETYLKTNDYLDKAGGYGIQSMAAVFIPRIEGCYYNVMGLPLHLFFRLATRIGLSLF